MSIRDHILDLGARHFFTFDNKEKDEDGIESETPTKIKDGEYSFVERPVCEGFRYSLKSTNADDDTTRTNGATLKNQKDINTSSANKYWNNSNGTWMFWTRIYKADNPSVIYEQGASVNNIAFISGTGGLFSFQAADDERPFLIAFTKWPIEEMRNYFLVGRWEKASYSGESDNRILFYVNGVLQRTIMISENTDEFPTHSGDINVGNSDDSLKYYNDDTVKFATRRKWFNLFAMFTNKDLAEADFREVFERTVIPEITIQADTVINQQKALDDLIGTRFGSVNCAIRIVQATDATDYKLIIEDIMFKQNEYIKDINIQFVGTGSLLVDCANGTNVEIVSTPPEVELVDETLDGGGSISVQLDSLRIHNTDDLENINISGNLYLKIDSEDDHLELNYHNVRVQGKVFNETDKSITINANTTCHLEADQPGIGSGEVNIQTTHNLTLNNVIIGSEVRLYNNDLTEEIFGVEEADDSDISIDYLNSYPGAVLVIFKKDYEVIRMALDLGNGDITIPIQQRKDKWYTNP